MIQITAQIENELEQIAGKHLPFATSLALNRTAKEARDVVAGNLPKRFKLKRGSIPKTIKAVMSKKNNLMAMVTAPGFLGIHETGGTMKPTSSSLLASKVGNTTTRALRNRSGTYRRDMGDGNAAIFKRTGRKGKGSIRMLAWLSDDHEFDERLHMADDVNEVVESRFGKNMRDAIAQALSSAR
jgi:hypothetical protein